jgi:hypothetical protein
LRDMLLYVTLCGVSIGGSNTVDTVSRVYCEALVAGDAEAQETAKRQIQEYKEKS